MKGKSLDNGGGVGEAGGVRRTGFFCGFLDFFVSFLLCDDPRERTGTLESFVCGGGKR